jgi:flagellar hook-basal body complex protein FliE
MEIANFILELFILGVLALAGLWIPGYVKKQAELKAETKYTGILTKIQETVKMEFDKERAELNAKLDFLTGHQLDIVSSEKEAIIDLTASIFKFIDICERPEQAYSASDDYGNNRLDAYIRDRDSAYNQYIYAESKAKILIDNTEILDLVNELNTFTLNNPYTLGNDFIYVLRTEYKVVQDTRHSVHFNSNHARLKEQDALSEIVQAVTKNMIAMQTFIPKRVVLGLKFQKACKEHIYKLLKKSS